MRLVLLPNQLAESVDGYEVYIYYEPLFFTGHKLKNAFLRAITIIYSQKTGAKIIDKLPQNEFHMYDPLDYRLIDKYISHKITYLPLKHSFMLTDVDLDYLYEKFKSHLAISNSRFFEYAKQKFGILVDVKSTDKQNQRRLPKSIQLPDDARDTNNSGIKTASILWANKNYPDNYGSTDELMNLPIDTKSAKKYFKVFLEQRFHNFGEYQDAIAEHETKLFHSHCSFLINAGLLTPKYVIEKVMSANVPINSKEGFIRQILGWREYMRFIYKYWGRALKKEMLKCGKHPLDFDSWTAGTTGISLIDNEIRKIQKHAWAHHIIRLMVFLNLMKNREYKVEDIYRWFMDFVSLDAYEWVMVSNIMAMGYYNKNPRFTYKPYNTTYKYVLRMSDYKSGEWIEKFTPPPAVKKNTK